MPVSQNDAVDALRDIDQAQARASRLYGYRIASPHLILWGVIWAFGYGASYVQPAWHLVWPALVAFGTIGSFWLGATMQPKAKAKRDWRYAATGAAITVFVVSVFLILPPVTSEQLGAFFPILVGFLYALVGIWSRGMRMLVAGVVLVALTLFGFFYLQPYFAPWMAIVGGGGLILGGIWLRVA